MFMRSISCVSELVSLGFASLARISACLFLHLAMFRKFNRNLDSVTIVFHVEKSTHLGVKMEQKEFAAAMAGSRTINKCNAHGPSDALALQLESARRPTPPPRRVTTKKTL